MYKVLKYVVNILYFYYFCEMTQDRIDIVNDWIKTVESIHSETVSISVMGSPFTLMDTDSYDAIEFKDGSSYGSKTRTYKPSIILNLFNEVLTDIGFTYTSYTKNRYFSTYCYLFSFDTFSISIEINPFHETLFNIKSSNYLIENREIVNIIDVRKSIFEIIDILLKNGKSESLSRHFKIKYLLS